MRQWFWISFMFLAFGRAGSARGDEPCTVGMTRAIDLWLPGPEVFAIPADDRRSPVIVRIDKAIPEHGGFRYTIAYTGFESGEHDLRKCLRLTNGSPPAFPPIPVEIQSVRPPGEIRLNTLPEAPAVIACL